MRFRLRVDPRDASEEFAVIGGTRAAIDGLASAVPAGLPLVWVDPWPGVAPGGYAYAAAEPHPGTERDWVEAIVPRAEEERIADAITRFTGSMLFVYLHLAFFGFWIVANLGWIPGVPSWDPSFVVLAMVASVEAIFLSTFVLISQNRMAAAADKRADLDLQVSLLAEHEVTRLVTLVSGIADRMGVRTEADADLDEITQDVAPDAVLDELEAAEPEAEQP